MMETMFNYIDLLFQLFLESSDETFTLVARHMNDLRKYYDKKSCLNLNHSEKVIDICRFCIIRDTILYKCLEKDFCGF